MHRSAQPPPLVLVVDDEAPDRAYLTATLLTAGYRVLTATGGGDARTIVSLSPRGPDLVLLDICMPEEDGLKLLAWIRSCPSTAHVPVILVSGHGGIPDRVAGFEAGAHDYVPKPIDSAELLARVRAHLRLFQRSETWRLGNLVDPLTELLNRRGVLAGLERELQRASRARETVSVAMIDIDGFKAVNDAFGHAAGDRVLKRFADAIRDTLRRCDNVGRWGGDEFVVILPRCDRVDADRALRRLRAAIIRIGVEEGFLLDASGGVATLRADDPPPDERAVTHLIEAADRAMYAEKRRRPLRRVPGARDGQVDDDGDDGGDAAAAATERPEPGASARGCPGY